jgi:hypothetical protein
MTLGNMRANGVRALAMREAEGKRLPYRPD